MFPSHRIPAITRDDLVGSAVGSEADPGNALVIACCQSFIVGKMVKGVLAPP